MALNLEIGSGLAFSKTSKAGNVYYEGEANLNGQRIKVVLGITKSKNTGRDMAWIKVEDLVSAQIEQAEARLEYLRNLSEKPDLRDEVAEQPDRTEKAVPSNKRRKVA